jgi:hypothetical protein
LGFSSLVCLPLSSKLALNRVSEPQSLSEMPEGKLQDIVWRGEKKDSCNEKQINIMPAEICIYVSFMYLFILRLHQTARPNNQPDSGSWACLSV